MRMEYWGRMMIMGRTIEADYGEIDIGTGSGGSGGGGRWRVEGLWLWLLVHGCTVPAWLPGCWFQMFQIFQVGSKRVEDEKLRLLITYLELERPGQTW